MTREESITNGLILAIPAISGSLALEIFKGEKLITNESVLCIFLTSVIGLLAIGSCIKYMRVCGFRGLMWYRILLGAMLILLF